MWTPYKSTSTSVCKGDELKLVQKSIKSQLSGVKDFATLDIDIYVNLWLCHNTLVWNQHNVVVTHLTRAVPVSLLCHRKQGYLYVWGIRKKRVITLEPGLTKMISCKSTLLMDYVEHVSFRWLENCGRSLRHNISPSDRLMTLDPPTLISLAGSVKTFWIYTLESTKSPSHLTQST